MQEKDLKRAAETIRASRGFVIVGHERPDGDALGSALALASTLRRLAKRVVVLFADGVPETYSFLPGTEAVVTSTDERGFDVASDRAPRLSLGDG